MKKILIPFFLFSFLTTLAAQPEINCDTVYSDPALSEYILPYPTGKTYPITQSNCSAIGGHNLTFAYDFDMALGDTIIASRAGVVTFVNDQYADTDWTSGHENNVFIRHSDGTRIRYTHLMQHGAFVNPNDQIVQGQVLGVAGSSGNTGGDEHLHLAAFKDGTSFNRQNTIPLNFCNTNDPVNSQNLLIEGQSYTAFDKSATTIYEPQLNEAISIHPNPVSTVLNIDLNTTNLILKQIQIFNLNGELIYSVIVEKNIYHIKIPINEFPKGMYFLVVKSNFEQVAKKILILN